MRANLRTALTCSLLLSLAITPRLRAEPPLDSVLDRTGRQVSAFLEFVSDVKCTEQVSQQKLDKRGRPELAETSTFDYLVLLEGSADELVLNESRLPVKTTAAPTRNTPLLVSNGFSTLFLIFHPYYRNSFEFVEEAEEVRGGERLLRVRFSHLRGKRTPAALAVRGREYPLDLAGTAWIDPENGMVARLEASLASDMRDVGLRSLSAEIDYVPVKLPGWGLSYRFPAVATVDVETLRQHWRNVHRFSDYKRFIVGTSEAVTNKTEPK